MKTIAYAKETKAIKRHQCDFCTEWINEGEVYLKSTHEMDGNVYDWKTHKDCAFIASELKMYEDADEGVGQDMFMEIISDRHFSLLTDSVHDEVINTYRDIIRQLSYVRFREKLRYVIAHYRKLQLTPSPNPKGTI